MDIMPGVNLDTTVVSIASLIRHRSHPRDTSVVSLLWGRTGTSVVSDTRPVSRRRFLPPMLAQQIQDRRCVPHLAAGWEEAFLDQSIRDPAQAATVFA